jgi:nucleoside-diphosphate-sugar epimerase
MIKRALVIGATGSFGGHMATALLDDGWRVKALMRDPVRLPPWLQGLEVVSGDARQIEDVRHAAAGVEVIVYGANIPYPRWHREALPLLEPSVKVAEEQGLTLVFPGNVYGYDPEDGPNFGEETPFRPVSRKGAIRQRMEQRLQQASTHGAQILLLRAGDFIGAHAGSTWMHVLSKKTDHGYRLLRPGPADLVHTWANLPDLARATCRLLQRRDRLPSFAPFHFAGYRVTFNELVEAMQAASGKQVKVWPFPWCAVTLLAPLIPFLRELQEMRYLWQQEVNLDGTRLHDALNGELPYTPLPEALAAAGIIQTRSAHQAQGPADR